MASRHLDWFNQGKRDADLARWCIEGGHYEWACFAAQQAAEKVIKAVFQKLGGEAWGHSVTDLLKALPISGAVETELLDTARELDRHYIPARYPNAHPAGAPFEHYMQGEAVRAVSNAESLIVFREGVLAQPEGDGQAPSGGSEDAAGTAPGD
jgi:HEPN domain-containing protein